MNADVGKENPTIQVVSRISSAQLPRFAGVPGDETLLEDSSQEGILHGRSISEVVGQDTSELEAAHCTWDQAEEVLTYLAAACHYREVHFHEQTDALRRGGPVPSASVLKPPVSETERKLLFQQILSENSSLPGFPGIRAYVDDTRTYTQVWIPFRNPGIRGDPRTPVETVARRFGEMPISYEFNRGFAKIMTNAQTYIQAVAYHVLEKGNQYEMTGGQLAHLIRLFDRNDFDRQLGTWIAGKAREYRLPFVCEMGHTEIITFQDNSRMELEIWKNGSFEIKSSNQSWPRLHFSTNPSGELQEFSVINKYRKIFIGKHDGEWKIALLVEPNRDDQADVPISGGSILRKYIPIGDSIAQSARLNRDGLMPDTLALTLRQIMSHTDLFRI